MDETESALPRRSPHGFLGAQQVVTREGIMPIFGEALIVDLRRMDIEGAYLECPY